ncbi:hypothetical protein TNCV_1402171 [Trichonephila clavipes]|nr:hypothetical protein TNCV_1402171 [Trichonephila clavipes]
MQITQSYASLHHNSGPSFLNTSVAMPRVKRKIWMADNKCCRSIIHLKKEAIKVSFRLRNRKTLKRGLPSNSQSSFDLLIEVGLNTAAYALFLRAHEVAAVAEWYRCRIVARLVTVAQQPIRARVYCAHPSIRDHWALSALGDGMEAQLATRGGMEREEEQTVQRESVSAKVRGRPCVPRPCSNHRLRHSITWFS